MIVQSRFFPWLARCFGVDAEAVTLGPFIFVKKGHEPSQRLLRHEMVHVEQWKELWYVGFAVVYVWDWAVGLCKGYGLKNAYRSIRFEQEARAGQLDRWYLAEREGFDWRRFKV